MREREKERERERKQFGQFECVYEVLTDSISDARYNLEQLTQN